MSTKGWNKSTIAVIHGEGIQESGCRASLALVPNQPSVPQQLVIPGLPLRKKEVVSVGFDSIDFPAFVQVLRAGAIRRVIDIRVSPSFLGRGFSSATVNMVLRDLQVEYEHFPVLANRFIGKSWNSHVVMQMYMDHLKAHRDALQQLYAKIADGPVLLLGRTPHHEQSTRAAIVNELTTLKNDISLCIIDPQT